MPDEPRTHHVRHIVEAVCGDVWAIYEPKLEQIVGFLEQRANGVTLTADDIRATMRQEESQSFAAVLRRQKGSEENEGPLVIDGVQIMQLYGTLGPRMNLMMEFSGGTSTQQFAADLDRARTNDKVKTVLVEVDSPGGVVSGTEEARQAVLRFKQSGKRIVMFGRNLMASAAYYIGASGSTVVASPSTEVGSVGVYAIVYTATKAIEEAGLKYYVFRAGDLKAAGNAYEELSADRKAALQKRVDDPYRMFLAAVAEDRGVSVDTVASDFGKGSVFLAEEAKRRGMIDDVGLIESVYEFERSRNRGAVSVPVFRAANAAKECTGMNSRIKAALFARGLVDSVEASDELCQVAVNAYLAARGITASDDDSVIAALMLVQEKPKAEAKAEASPNWEQQEAKAVERERTRAADILVSADVFGIDRASAKSAIDSGQTHEDFVKAARAKKAAAEPPIDKGIAAVDSGEDRFAADATDALLYRLADRAAKPQISADAHRLARAPLVELARTSLEMCGQRVDRYASAEDIAEQAMSMAGGAKHRFYSDTDAFIARGEASGPYNRPGMFPYLLANLANKYMDQAIELAEATYRDWTAVSATGLKDFKPVPIVNKGQVDGMDEVLDAEAFREMSVSEEMLSYLFLRRFGNKWGWTPVMVANDDLGAFQEGMLGLQQGWEFTVNDLCLGLLTANAALLDGNALFVASTARGGSGGNYIASGTAPSDAAWAACEALYADFTGIGTTRRVRGTLNTILTPSGAAAQGARRTFETYPVLGETKDAATTANIGLYRGKVRIVVEPELRATSTTAWYALRNPTQPASATVIRAYQPGWGESGRREQWYDSDTKCTYVSIEGRVGAAVKGWRNAVLDSGTGGS